MRRRSLLSESDPFINGYVKNGLVAYFDGLDKGGDDGKWYSLVGDDVMTPYTDSGRPYSPVPGTDCFEFDATKKTWMFIIDGEKYPYHFFKTIEVVFFLNNPTAGNGVMTSPQFASMNVFVGSSRIIFSNDSALKRLIYVTSQNYNILSFNNNNNKAAYYNLNSYQKYVTGDYLDGVQWGIGGASSWRYFMTGRIYCVRYYNRELTSEEIISNQKNDIVRFNLPIQI